MVGGGGEQHQVTARHEFLCQPFVIANDGVGARRIDNIELLEQRQWIGVDGEVFIHDLLGDLLAPLHQCDARGGRRRAFGQHFFAQQRVDQGTLSGIEFTHHHHQEQLVQLQDRILQGPQRVARHIQLGQREPHFGQRLLFLPQESGLFIGQHRLAHRFSFLTLL